MPIRNHHWVAGISVTTPIIYSLGCSYMYNNSCSDTMGSVANSHLQWFNSELVLLLNCVEFSMFSQCEEL